MAVPEAIRAPAGEELVLEAHATGTQNYECRNGAWALTGPQAVLKDANGESLGRHFAGPTWALADGSQVVGTLVAKADAPNDGAVPWLLLHVSSHGDAAGSGQLARVSSIQRVDTHGGTAPTSGCTDEQRLEVPYSATYEFYAAP